MLVLRESLAIFKRNPLTSALTLVLIVAASVGQVLSLSSLYPILQTFVTDQNGARLAKRSDALSLRALRAEGIEPGEILERLAFSASK